MKKEANMKKPKKNTLSKIWDIVKIFLGALCLIIGFAGLFLPIIPGILFLIAGLALLGNKQIKNYFKTLINLGKKEKSK